LWQRLIRQLSARYPILANQLKSANQPAIFGPNILVIRFTSDYNHLCEACATDGNIIRIQEGLQKITGQLINIRFETVDVMPPGVSGQTARNAPANPVTERRKLLMTLPLFRRASEVLGAQIWHMDEEFNPDAPPQPSGSIAEDPDEN
jgi:DNA polymerase III subunit gamma/tau